MRVTQSEIYRNFLSDLGTLNEQLESGFSRQVSSGKLLQQPERFSCGQRELVLLSEQAVGYRPVSVQYRLRFLFPGNGGFDSQRSEQSDDHNLCQRKSGRLRIDQFGRACNDCIGNSFFARSDTFARQFASARPISFAGSNDILCSIYAEWRCCFSTREDQKSTALASMMEWKWSMSVAGSDAFNSVFSAIDSLACSDGCRRPCQAFNCSGTIFLRSVGFGNRPAEQIGVLSQFAEQYRRRFLNRGKPT